MIFLELLLTFFKIGAFTFGGGYAMLPLIQEAVLKNGWLTEEQIINFIAVSESTPGPFAINIATYVGSVVGGTGGLGPVWGGILGAFVATLGVVLPSFIIILIVAKFYERFKKSSLVSGAMTGLKPAVVGLIGAAKIKLALTVFFPAGLTLTVFSSPAFYISLAIFATGALLAFKKVHPIIIILLSGVLGVIAGYLIL
ncbi:MAG: chromate transporter [Clostridia bacterium]|nr:chromate transporter [Clostridia bacterium]